MPGEGGVNPVIQCLDRLKELNSVDNSQNGDEIAKLLDELTELCNSEGSGNSAIASRNGAIELVCSICSKLSTGCQGALVSALKAMALLLDGMMDTLA